MGLIQKLFGPKRPTLPKTEFGDFQKFEDFVVWFIKNEPIANTILNRSSNIIYNEGYRPILAGTHNDPELLNPNINSLPEWFITKIFITLNDLRDARKEEFRDYIDSLDEAGSKTLTAAGEVSVKYNIKLEGSSYEAEIQKIPAGEERESFKQNLLSDNVVGAEMRILGWLYHEYFGEWYQLKEKRNQ